MANFNGYLVPEDDFLEAGSPAENTSTRSAGGRFIDDAVLCGSGETNTQTRDNGGTLAESG